MPIPGGSADITRILVATDGRPANLTQALGLAEAIAVYLPAAITQAEIALRPGFAGWPNRLLLPFGGRALHGLPHSPYELVIGAGRRGNLAAALLGRRGCKTVAILKPHLPTDAFSALVIPAHDRLHDARVLTTLGALNRLTAAALDRAARPFPSRPAPRLAVLIGGPSRSARFDADALLRDLGRFASWSILATASRRTPKRLIAQLRATQDALWLWDGTGVNPYPGLLAAADAILVTSDSVNMACEAASTGKPVFVSGLPSPGKNARFHAALAAHGASRPAAEVPVWSDAPMRFSYPPLHEAARIAPLLLNRLGFAQSPGAAYRDG
ncbi:MAG: mitochondrial fission ELM1 family protein [Pseudomonadota bacterium]